MSKYTTEVRFICEENAGLTDSEGYTSINRIISDSIPKIFDFNFPIFDEEYRPVLERKILKHYYTREICCETVGLWKHFLDRRLNEIMPYYNKLYQSELLTFNPLYDTSLTRDHQGSGTKDSELNSTNDAENTNTRTDNLTTTDDHTRTDDLTREDNLTREDDLTREDNLTREDDLKRTDDFKRTDDLVEDMWDTRTPNLTDVTKNENKDTVNVGSAIKNTRWDIYSDTPQGSLTNVNNENYLTNARKIIDDGSGTIENTTTTYGKKTTVTRTGTEDDVIHKTNTGSTKNVGTSKNTGTVTNSGTVTSTGTVTNSGTVTNTGTQRNAGTETHTGTQTNTEIKSNTVETTEGISTTDEYLEHVIGKSAGTSYSKLLMEYRETFINIDMLIIEDLHDLFMELW